MSQKLRNRPVLRKRGPALSLISPRSVGYCSNQSGQRSYYDALSSPSTPQADLLCHGPLVQGLQVSEYLLLIMHNSIFAACLEVLLLGQAMVSTQDKRLGVADHDVQPMEQTRIGIVEFVLMGIALQSRDITPVTITVNCTARGKRSLGKIF